MLDLFDTIAAIASPPGGAARGIVRLSGPGVIGCVRALFRKWTLVAPRHPSRQVCHLKLPVPLGDIPCDLYLWPGERSYTQQPSAELHLPGSAPIVQAALAEACRHGARIAQPGEFTLRAFLAGRLDLTQAEAVLGVIDAQAQRELKVALTQLAGGLAGPLNTLRDELLDLLAHLEAGLDFVEEEIEFISSDELTTALTTTKTRIDEVLAQLKSRQATTDAWRVVVTGRPNAGKSSLLNALAVEEAAIVSPIAGTTRDYVAREFEIEGFRCLLTDTAGLAGATDTPDAAAEARANRLLDEAHLVLLCLESTAGQHGIEDCRDLRTPSLRVLTKCDLVNDPSAIAIESDSIATSAKTGQGLAELQRQIAHQLRQLAQESGAAVASTAARCHDSLHSASAAVERAQQLVHQRASEELIAAELRLALDELGQVVGAVYTDDVLDRIFSRFCIGK